MEKRIEWLDELRAIAIIFVIISHSLAAIGIANTYFHIGPDIFLIVSGISMVLFSKTTQGSLFLRKKLIRLLPAYWIAIAVCMSFWYIHTLYGISAPSIGNVIVHIFALQSFFGPEYMMGINQSWWYITIAFLGYFVFLAIRKHVENWSLMIFLAGLFTAIATIGYWFTNNDSGLALIAPRIINLFIGFIIGSTILSKYASAKVYENTGLFIIGLILLIFCNIKFGITAYYPVLGLIAIFGWMYLRKYILTTWFGNKVLLVLLAVSTISYELYLIHQPFVTYMILFPDKWGSNYLGLFIGIIAAFAGAIALKWTSQKIISLFK